MLGNGYSWNFRSRNDSFAEFTAAPDSTQLTSYQTTDSGSDFNIHISTSCMAPTQSTLQENTSGKHPIPAIESRSNLAVQSNCSQNITSAGPSSSTYSSIPKGNSPTKEVWCSEPSDIHNVPFEDYCGLTLVHDGLPLCRMLDEQNQTHRGHGDMWSMDHDAGAAWISQPKSGSPAIISPKSLTLDVPPVRLSSSETSNDLMLSLSDLNTSTSSEDDDLYVLEKVTVEKAISVRPRQILPNSIPVSQRKVPGLAYNDHNIGKKGSMKRPLTGTSDTNRRTKTTPAHTNKVNHLFPIQPSRSKSLPKRIEPKPINTSIQHSWTKTSHPTKVEHHRDAKDIFLVESKQAGMSYKDIKKQGGFHEAESTLRGRFRTLTKDKSERVRKPEWKSNDVNTARFLFEFLLSQLTLE